MVMVILIGDVGAKEEAKRDPRRIEEDETLNLPWRDYCEREEGFFAPKPHWCLARLTARYGFCFIVARKIVKL